MYVCFVGESACACCREEPKQFTKHRKLPIATLKKSLSMTNKSVESLEIWLAVLTACHKRRP